MITWDSVRAHFERKGAWFDLFVPRVTLRDWQRMLDMLRATSYKLTYAQAGERRAFPRTAVEAFPAPGLNDRLMTVTFSGVVANCHFLSEDEIEMDLDPYDVKGQAELDALLGFMRKIALAIGKDVLLTVENKHDQVVIRVEAPN